VSKQSFTFNPGREKTLYDSRGRFTRGEKEGSIPRKFLMKLTGRYFSVFFIDSREIEWVLIANFLGHLTDFKVRGCLKILLGFIKFYIQNGLFKTHVQFLLEHVGDG
jgi:hypothetical protein